MANHTIAEKAIIDIHDALTNEDVNAIKMKTFADVAKTDEEVAEKALVNEAVKVVENAKSVQAVENAKSDFVEEWKELHTQEDPDAVI